DDRRQRATFFCLGWIARKNSGVVRRIAGNGHEIACHSDMHQLVYELGAQKFREDLKTAIESLEDIVGEKVVTYRAPGFSVTAGEAPWFFEVLGEQGITVDCSIFVGRHGHGGMPHFPGYLPTRITWSGGIIREFPMGGASVFGRPMVYSGGGYFRLLPYGIIRELARRQNYVMTYFHPRDFDSEQPVAPGLPPIRRFKSYVGLKAAAAKLGRLLQDFKFVDVRSAVATVRWEETPQIAASSLGV
ncbi:MAG TPA: polysaccharide deacetylase family protein, partial [Anaerolineales bacterium]